MGGNCELFLLVCIVQLVQDIFPLEAIKKFPFIKFQDTTAVSKSNTFKNPEVENSQAHIAGLWLTGMDGALCSYIHDCGG